jgi:hypothetical protein
VPKSCATSGGTFAGSRRRSEFASRLISVQRSGHDVLDLITTDFLGDHLAIRADRERPGDFGRVLIEDNRIDHLVAQNSLWPGDSWVSDDPDRGVWIARQAEADHHQPVISRDPLLNRLKPRNFLDTVVPFRTRELEQDKSLP